MSACTTSQIFAMELIKLIFVARNAFDACLINSALAALVLSNGAGEDTDLLPSTLKSDL